MRCLCAANFDGKFAVIITDERHITKDSTIIANMTDVTKVILWQAYQARVQLLAWSKRES